MNLKTHTAYPQIKIYEGYSFDAKLIDAKGKVVFYAEGQGESKEDATLLALEALEPEKSKYLIREKV